MSRHAVVQSGYYLPAGSSISAIPVQSISSVPCYWPLSLNGVQWVVIPIGPKQTISLGGALNVSYFDLIHINGVLVKSRIQISTSLFEACVTGHRLREVYKLIRTLLSYMPFQEQNCVGRSAMPPSQSDNTSWWGSACHRFRSHLDHLQIRFFSSSSFFF